MAFRNIWRNSRRTLLASLTLGVGMAFLVISACFITGFHSKWIEGVARFFLGHIQIFQKGYYVHYYSLNLEKAMNTGEEVRQQAMIPGVESASLRLETLGFGSYAGKFHTMRIVGIQPENEKVISLFARKIRKGEYLSDQPEEKKQILVGQGFASDMGLEVGSRILVMVQTFAGDVAYEVFFVQGIFQTGHPDVDNFVVLVHLTQLREIMAQEMEYFTRRSTSVVLLVNPARHTPLIAKKLRERLDNRQYEVLTWEEMAPDLKALLQLNQATWTIFILILFLVSIVSTTNAMLMSVMERIREFGLLTSMGMAPVSLMGMVFLEALYLGLMGGTIGFGAGLLLSAHFAQVGLDLSWFQKGLAWMIGEDTRVFFEFPIPLLILLFLSMQVVAVVSALYPAWKASRVNPIEAMRFA